MGKGKGLVNGNRERWIRDRWMHGLVDGCSYLFLMDR
jgi:hypothetical protein